MSEPEGPTSSTTRRSRIHPVCVRDGGDPRAQGKETTADAFEYINKMDPMEGARFS